MIGKYGGENLADVDALAEDAFKRALQINPDLAVAHGLYAYLEADLGLAEHALVRLLDQPATVTDPELLAGLVHVCRYCGLLDESVAAHECARRLDPTVRTSVAQTFWVRRDYERAIDADVDSPSYISILAVDGLGRTQEAIALASEALRRPRFRAPPARSSRRSAPSSKAIARPRWRAPSSAWSSICPIPKRSTGSGGCSPASGRTRWP